MCHKETSSPCKLIMSSSCWSLVKHCHTINQCVLCLQCPLFLLFLDCISQLRKKFPGSFQFSDVYLVHVWDALNSGMFGTFAFNSPHDRSIVSAQTNGAVSMPTASRLPYLLPSAWNWSQQFADPQISLMYDPLYTAACDLDITTNGRKPQQRIALAAGTGLRTGLLDVRLWSLCYLRWLSPVMIIGGGAACEYLTQCLLVEEISELHQQVTGSSHHITRLCCSLVLGAAYCYGCSMVCACV